MSPMSVDVTPVLRFSAVNSSTTRYSSLVLSSPVLDYLGLPLTDTTQDFFDFTLQARGPSKMNVFGGVRLRGSVCSGLISTASQEVKVPASLSKPDTSQSVGH